MGFLSDGLVKKIPFDYDEKEKQNGGLFYEALMEEIRFHYDNNDLYRGFCNNKGFNPNLFSGDIGQIPPVQVSVFKELGNRLNSVPKNDIKLTLEYQVAFQLME